jgi:multidrug/hemolysin transport system permease protein
MIIFAVRNLRLFFRDTSAVFFSLLASLIVIALYVLSSATCGQPE